MHEITLGWGEVEELMHVRDGWQRAALVDAMRYIVTHDIPVGGWTPTSFFAHGADEVGHVIARLDRMGLRGDGRARALDFGCGIGRLTQSLAVHYECCIGVDISEEMVRQARAFNRHGDRCRYVLNERDDLSLFADGTFDLIYSSLVLMHLPGACAQRYVSEFIRLIAPGGVAVFQLPEGDDVEHPEHWLSVRGTARREVEAWIEQAGAAVHDVATVSDVAGFTSYRYTVRRIGAEAR